MSGRSEPRHSGRRRRRSTWLGSGPKARRDRRGSKVLYLARLKSTSSKGDNTDVVSTAERTCSLVVSALVGLLSAGASGQTVQTTTDSKPIGSTLTSDTLRDLPLSDSVYAVLETTQPEVIADRFNSGGLNAVEGSRLGGFLGSWSQTLFRV